MCLPQPSNPRGPNPLDFISKVFSVKIYGAPCENHTQEKSRTDPEALKARL